jgi:hypothetical protein
VIVRISMENQYEVPDESIDRLNELDNEAQQAVEAADEGRLHELLTQMAELVRTEGTPLGDDVLAGSDVIIPPPDSTLAEVGEAFAGEGLIPD